MFEPITKRSKQIARQYHCYKPKTCIISNGFVSVGIALPGAIPAKLVNPDKKVIAVTGDGGFMMNCQELEPAVRIRTPFVTLIFNDKSYELIKWKQLNRMAKTATSILATRISSSLRKASV